MKLALWRLRDKYHLSAIYLSSTLPLLLLRGEARIPQRPAQVAAERQSVQQSAHCVANLLALYHGCC